MKAKILSLLLLFICSPVAEALACAVCYGAKDSKSSQNMAIAIWFLVGAVMSVIGGVGAFSFHIWRHARGPLQPHQEITEEELDKYE
jgi:putative Mn2+ efflux pump MntP